MTLNATAGGNPDLNVGVGGTQTLAFTVVNNNHAQIIEFDSAATSGGSLDLQSGAAITAGFVGNFAVTGYGFIGGSQWAFGGVVTSTGAAVSGTADQDIAGTPETGFATAGVVSAADANGRGTFNLGGVNFVYYIVGAEAVRFIEVDAGGVTTGTAMGQGSAPSFSAASLSGAYVMDVPWPTGEGPDGPFAFAGQFSADGVSAITGVVDYNQAGFVDPGPGPDTLGASYTVAATGPDGGFGYGNITSGVVTNDSDFTTWGVYLVDPAINIIDPNNSSGGGGALIVELDAFALGAGWVIPQTATAETVVNNGEDFVAISSTNDFINTVGQVALSSAASVGSESVNDLNFSTPSQTETSGVSLSGAITADTTNAGRYTLVLTPGSSATPLNLVVYVVSGGLSIDVEVDSSVALTQLGSGTAQGQQ